MKWKGRGMGAETVMLQNSVEIPHNRFGRRDWKPIASQVLLLLQDRQFWGSFLGDCSN